MLDGRERTKQAPVGLIKFISSNKIFLWRSFMKKKNSPHANVYKNIKLIVVMNYTHNGNFVLAVV